LLALTRTSQPTIPPTPSSTNTCGSVPSVTVPASSLPSSSLAALYPALLSVLHNLSAQELVDTAAALAYVAEQSTDGPALLEQQQREKCQMHQEQSEQMCQLHQEHGSVGLANAIMEACQPHLGLMSAMQVSCFRCGRDYAWVFTAGTCASNASRCNS
jgi:hypothetical protein